MPQLESPLPTSERTLHALNSSVSIDFSAPTDRPPEGNEKTKKGMRMVGDTFPDSTNERLRLGSRLAYRLDHLQDIDCNFVGEGFARHERNMVRTVDYSK